jgi:retron-type reverse transcriptase
VLEKLIKEHFEDPELICLYWKFVKAGYMERLVQKNRYNFVKGVLGVPQGGIISPLLSNLVLHELDKYVSGLIKANRTENKGKKNNSINPEYLSLSAKLKMKRKSSIERMNEEGRLHLSQSERKE